MKTTPQRGTKSPQPGLAGSGFEKVGECLYRYISNGVYYAFLKQNGKKLRHSLETTDRATAKMKLADKRSDLSKVDASQGKLTLRALSDRYLASIASQATDTIALKTTIVKRLLEEFRLGADCQVGKIKPSDLQGWIASYDFGYSSYNHYLQVVKALFEIAVNDGVIFASPAKDMKGKKVVTPIRITPSYEDFNAIIANVRSQKWNAEAQDSADYLEFMGLIGVGQAEASGIQKQHVILGKKQLTFFRVKTKKPYTVPIFPQAEALVAKLYKKAKQQTDALFPVNLSKSKNKKPVCSKDAKKALHAACKRLGLPAYTQRSLRRMFITRCIEKGIDVKVIAQWQGHSDGGKLILGTYSHVRNSHAEDMAKLLAAE
jgi:integrase